MKFFEWLKGVFRNMFSSDTIETALHIQPAVSSKMKDAIELWEDMYVNNAPWLNDENIVSLGLPAMIASEKARTATIEMEIKVTGESERAKYFEDQAKKLLLNIRKELEYGIALGGLIIKPYVVQGIDDKYTIEFSYVKACDFYPLSFSNNGDVSEAAFVDRIISKDTIYSKVEYHKIEGTTLIVKNAAFRSTNRSSQVGVYSKSDLGNPIPLTEVPDWANIAPEVKVENIDTLFFAYFKMPEANTVDLDSPLGVSGFSKAADLIKNADEQYSNLLWEFEGGQLAIDVDRTALNPMYDSKGHQIEVLPKLQDRLFRHSLDLGEDNTYEVFSPQLRDTNIINGLNTILTRIEDVCSISRGTLSDVTYSEARTATELRILKQRTFSANMDIQKELQHTLEKVFKIIEKYCDLYGIVPSGEYEIAYKWDDSIIVDKDAERQVDMMDVTNGILSKVEYRMKWMGETRKQAEDAIKECNDEKVELMTMQQEVMMEASDNIASATQKNAENNKDAAASQTKLQHANDSGEKTKLNSNDDDARKK